MAGLIEKLDAAGYDTAGLNEADLLKKLDAAGYDTSNLGGQSISERAAKEGWEGATPLYQPIPEKAPAQGLGALGSLASGEGLQQASQIAQGQAQPQTRTGKLGAFVGEMVSPTSILASAVMEPGQAARAAAQGIKSGAQAIGSKVGEVAATLRAPGQAEAENMAQQMAARNVPNAVGKAREYMSPMLEAANDKITALKQALTQIGTDISAKKAAAGKLLMKAKNELQAFQESAGIGDKPIEALSDLTKSKKSMAQLAETMAKIKEIGAEKLKDIMPPEAVQDLRMKAMAVSQHLRRSPGDLPGVGKAMIEQGRQVTQDTLKKQLPEFGPKLENVLKLKDYIDALPQAAKEKVAGTRSMILEAQAEAKALEKEATQLYKSAARADKAQLAEIKQKGLELIQRGIQHDKLVSKIKNTIIGATVAGTGVGALKHFGG